MFSLLSDRLAIESDLFAVENRMRRGITSSLHVKILSRFGYEWWDNLFGLDPPGLGYHNASSTHR
ncbi:hypothetical protein IGI04_016078 [Brassica rapa subsp. trilocularis]|uniref:Uncharacterized protein n=1 Tax=Brassica rapa subsp. trilocularis TaxID=1813537 RepID=A0ABQ7MUE2_BRACM|nr:hypothetical protein IGI04_016078 [Brassica rapa subsp. trilocularis]